MGLPIEGVAMMKKSALATSSLAVAALLATGLSPALAENAMTAAAFTADQGVAAPDPLARFVPAADRTDHTIDYRHWDEALAWFVIPMGPPLRITPPPKAEPRLGTRITYGHTSRFRLEGNRIAFSMLTDEVRAALTEYRQDLERVGTELDLARLPRNEQLAYWLNLHNVAVIEALAHEYPLRTPAEGRFGTNDESLQDATLVTVKGVALSPRDIRERIVYPNWRDPKVIYGFWRGEIGGPSIQRLAYSGANVDTLLDFGAEEFANSLRGVDAWGGRLRVSRIYDEAKPFYFADEDVLRDHLRQYAREDVQELIEKNARVSYTIYDEDIADLMFGKGDPDLNVLCTVDETSIGAACTLAGAIPDAAAMRLMEERAQKLYRAWKRGIRTGMVIFGDGTDGEYGEPKEVR
ncbi:hypothetical protein EH32_02555 [Erythrobacter litoralis]|uniref:DUF547 domain-containing protein n=3 Tax=Erythrobacter/Porphyrobacter group TaxID=2800788 RepID=A0A074M5A0_9SPHN|nr:hypothetical protein EH32_02555 [Erythrobacter litoralis]